MPEKQPVFDSKKYHLLLPIFAPLFRYKMRPIRMVDLESQHQKIRTELDAAIAEVIDNSAFIHGQQVKAFENELAAYLNVKHVIGCANGTDALQLALMALELPKGSEIITTDFTFVATAEVIRLLGFTPVLVDVDADTFNIDPARIEEAITEKTKAIIPVHLFGQCAEMNDIISIAKENNLYVIEDTAQAIGTTYNFDGKTLMAGTIGNIGTTSFFPSKNLGAMGDGGALFTNDDALAKKLRSMANHGQGAQYFYQDIGINSRLDTLQAAVLRVKLKHLDSYIKARQKATARYNEVLAGIEGIETPFIDENSTHTFHQYTLKIKNGMRDELMKELSQKGIPNKVYYPLGIHQHKPYANESKYSEEALSVSKQLSHQVLSLPMHTELDEEQLTFITDTIREFAQNKVKILS